MNISLIVAFGALIIALFALFFRFFLSFDLVVQVREILPWTDKDNFFRLDLGVTFVNMGKKPGWIEDMTVLVDNSGKEILLKPEIRYQLNQEGKPVPKEHFRPFLLSGLRDQGKLLGFKCQQLAETLPDGALEAILTVIYKKDPRKDRSNKLNIKIPLEIDKKAALREGKTRIPPKKPGTVFPFNWEMLNNFFENKK